MGVLRNGLNWYGRIIRCGAVPIPPYDHVVQIGDPRLRRKSSPVPLDQIKSIEIQKVLSRLQVVLNKYSAVGMSAPQIGINYRIFVMKCLSQNLDNVPNQIKKETNMDIIPYTVFINPVLSVIDHHKIIQAEGCVSVRSFTADVARYNEVQVKGLNAEGEPISESYRGLPARIVQHEMDHLDGKLYVDIMDSKTLSCTCWDEINLARGKVHIPFGPE